MTHFRSNKKRVKLTGRQSIFPSFRWHPPMRKRRLIDHSVLNEHLLTVLSILSHELGAGFHKFKIVWVSGWNPNSDAIMGNTTKQPWTESWGNRSTAELRSVRSVRKRLWRWSEILPARKGEWRQHLRVRMWTTAWGKASSGNAKDSCSFEQLLKEKLRHIVCARLLQSCPTLCDHIYGLQPTRLLCPSDSPGKNSAFLQRIFLTQGLNLCLLHLLALAGTFFTIDTTWEAPKAHNLLIYSFQKKMMDFILFYFWPCITVYGIVVPWPGIKPEPPAVKWQRLNHWTARDVPRWCISKVRNRIKAAQ